MKTTRVLLVDDSATFRSLARAHLSSEAGFEVVGEASDGLRGVELAVERRPDVVVMDVEMPRLDGYEATRRIMSHAPTPVVIVSALSDRAVQTSLEALRAGALTALSKPPGPDHPDAEAEWRHFVRVVRSMAGVRVVRRHRRRRSLPPEEPAAEPDRPPHRPAGFRASVVALAASTGGPAAVREILGALPADYPVPILLVQHIGADFVEGLARWLDATVPLEVGLARPREPLRGGRVYIAPSDGHLTVVPGPKVAVTDDAPIGGFRPSATATYRSVAGAYGAGALGVILTGMGRDGVSGLHDLRRLGGFVLAQDEASSVVHSMPGHAIREGLADAVLPLDAIPGYLRRSVE